MTKKFSALFALLAVVVSLTACAPAGPAAPMEIRKGVIEQITDTTIKSDEDTGVGAVLGGLGGLGVGALIGAGTGKAVAMTIGAIGGAVGGAMIAKHYDKPIAAQQKAPVPRRASFPSSRKLCRCAAVRRLMKRPLQFLQRPFSCHRMTTKCGVGIRSGLHDRGARCHANRRQAFLTQALHQPLADTILPAKILQVPASADFEV